LAECRLELARGVIAPCSDPQSGVRASHPPSSHTKLALGQRQQLPRIEIPRPRLNLRHIPPEHAPRRIEIRREQRLQVDRAEAAAARVILLRHLPQGVRTCET